MRLLFHGLKNSFILRITFIALFYCNIGSKLLLRSEVQGSALMTIIFFALMVGMIYYFYRKRTCENYRRLNRGYEDSYHYSTQRLYEMSEDRYSDSYKENIQSKQKSTVASCIIHPLHLPRNGK